MKTTRSLLSKVVVSVVMLLTACQEGVPGPAGEKGSQGEKGIQGEKGDVGSANVIYGGWVNMDVAGFWYTVGTNIWEASYAANLSQDQLDKGAVFVYGKDNATGTVKLLPYNPSSSVTIQSTYKINRIVIQQIFYSGRPAVFGNQGFQQFRYILIPGGVTGARKPAIDYSDYEAVKRAFNIPE